jgi:hypothetical protein
VISVGNGIAVLSQGGTLTSLAPTSTPPASGPNWLLLGGIGVAVVVGLKLTKVI